MIIIRISIITLEIDEVKEKENIENSSIFYYIFTQIYLLMVTKDKSMYLCMVTKSYTRIVACQRLYYHLQTFVLTILLMARLFLFNCIKYFTLKWDINNISYPLYTKNSCVYFNLILKHHTIVLPKVTLPWSIISFLHLL